MRDFLPPAEIANDHFGLRNYGIHIIRPPLKHLLTLLCVLGAVVNACDTLFFMAQSLLYHVCVPTILAKTSRRCPSLVVNRKRLDIEGQTFKSLV